MTPPDATILSRAQVREIDRRAIQEYGIPGIVLMENAGRSAAEIIRTMLRPQPRVAIVCGPGNNGGDGFVIARHLANAGVSVRVLLACDPRRLTGDAATNFAIVRRMELPIEIFDDAARVTALRPALAGTDLIVDALLGTGFSGQVRPPLDLAIEAINTTPGATIVAIDVPSGLDCDTGIPSGPAIRADATITFVARKKGFPTPEAAYHVGTLHVADIGVPTNLIAKIAAADPNVL